jgi:mannose-1-phosphate guanylyltransferase/mannose-6-phosphate isomerase
MSEKSHTENGMVGLILAGGTGTRFWPLSREAYPKQLLHLFGDQTLIQTTLSRVGAVLPDNQIYIVTNPQQKEQIQLQLQGIASKPHFITEPMGRNTAAAIGLAAMILSQKDPNGIMVVLSADHCIRDEKAFMETVRLGTEIAQQDYLVTIGAKPTRPETAYGYIQKGDSLLHHPDGFSVARFVEKPDRPTAEKYLKSGDFYWNTGIFIWKLSTLLKEMMRYLPDLYEGLRKITPLTEGACDPEELTRIYSELPSVSIDYGVLEKSDRLAVVPACMEWEDVGSWNALDEVMPKDADGNIITGNVVQLGCTNTILYARNRVVAAVGLSDLVIADTDDATLICAKDRAQEVKQVVEILKRRNEEAQRIHRTVIRPWGSYTVLEEGVGFKIKRIVVNPRSRLSLQMHGKRSEHWVVVAGFAEVTCGESVYTIGANESAFIPIGTKHRLGNNSDTPLQIIEVQCGPYLGEDDITRFSDDFGRAK